MYNFRFLSPLILIISFGFFTSTSAQDTDKKADEILKQVTNKTKSYKTIKADFTFKMENKASKINESKKGTISLKGEKYRLSIAGQLVICDGKTVWTYIEDAEEVQINNVLDDNETITPDKILTSYNADYKSKFVKEAAEAGKTIQTIDLTPKKGKSFTKIRIRIDKTAQQISSFAVFDKEGNTYTYVINKLEHDIAVDDSNFTFSKSKFPNAEIVDMR